MKAQELRIGNLINKDGRPWEVIGVDIANFEYEVNRVGFEPIPLTSEWLERFGFDKGFSWHKKTHETGNYTGRIEVVETDPLGKWSVYFTDRNDEFVILKPEGQMSVHQLQNLFFALTGTELTLKQPS